MKKNTIYYILAAVVVVYVVYTYIYKKSSNCSACEIRKDKILKSFGIKTPCRKKYEDSGLAGHIAVASEPTVPPTISFEAYVNEGGCNKELNIQS